MLNTSQQNATISVAFQSPLNGEVWWDAEDNRRGVVSRPMARRFRSGEAAGRVHGYRGRQFTLIRRGAGGLPTADKTVDVALVRLARPRGHIRGRRPAPGLVLREQGPGHALLAEAQERGHPPVAAAPAAWDRPAHDAGFGGPWRRQADVPGDLVVVREVVRFARACRGGTVQRACCRRGPTGPGSTGTGARRRRGAGPPPPPPSDSGQFRDLSALPPLPPLLPPD